MMVDGRVISTLLACGGASQCVFHMNYARAIEEKLSIPSVVPFTNIKAIGARSAGCLSAISLAAGKSSLWQAETLAGGEDVKLWNPQARTALRGWGLNDRNDLRRYIQDFVVRSGLEGARVGDVAHLHGVDLHIHATKVTAQGLESVIFDEEVDLVDAVVASCSLGILFEPQEIAGELYIDTALFSDRSLLTKSLLDYGDNVLLFSFFYNSDPSNLDATSYKMSLIKGIFNLDPYQGHPKEVHFSHPYVDLPLFDMSPKSLRAHIEKHWDSYSEQIKDRITV